MLQKIDNEYLFIIWNKSLWCKKRIFNDLKNNFEIVNSFYVNWNKENFDTNLISLYGSKISNLKEKKHYIGTGEFYIVIVNDSNSIFRTIKQNDEIIQVNENIYSKKKLYRKWTGESFRIHASLCNEESSHDLTVLFGKDYQQIIDNTERDSHITLDTKTSIGFNDIDDVVENLAPFNNSFIIKENNLYLFTECKLDTIRFLNIEHIEDLTYNIFTKKNNYMCNIYGEKEGDIPQGFVSLAKENLTLQKDFLKVVDDYNESIKISNMSNDVNVFFEKYRLNKALIKKDTLRIAKKLTLIDKIKKEVKYILAKLKYGKE